MKTQYNLDLYIKKMQNKGIRLHSALLYSNYELQEVHYFPPYNREMRHRAYSTTKSFVAIAVGKLYTQGLINLDDKIVDYFREEFQLGQLPEYLENNTIRNMLMMNTCYSASTYGLHRKDWVRSYFDAKPTHPAGTLWFYDSSGSYVMGALVKRLTGKDFVSYLRPEFDILGLSPDITCVAGPDGDMWAGSGLLITPEDLARVAYWILNKGNWKGQQLLDPQYCTDAVSPLICNYDDVSAIHVNRGYGYQIWAIPNGGFIFKGLGGQFAIGFPDKDLVFVCTADVQGSQFMYDELIDGVYEYILGEDMTPRLPAKENVLDQIANVTYEIDPNPSGFSTVCVRKDENGTSLCYTKNGVELELPFDTEQEITFNFPETFYGSQLLDEAQRINYKCQIQATWVEKHKLFLRIWANDIYVGNMAISLSFVGDKIGIKMSRAAQFFFDDYQGYYGGKKIK